MSAPAKIPAMVVFKPVPGGFVYRAPKEWLIGRSNHYFVTEAQKNEIIALSTPPTLGVILGWMMSMVVLGVGTAMTISWVRHSFQFDEPTPADTAIIMVTMVLAVLLACKLAFRPLMNRLRPLLATLPKSDVRITGGEMQRAVMGLATAKQLRRQAALFGVIGACSLVQLLVPGRGAMSGDPKSILSMVVASAFFALVVVLLRQARQKAWQEQTRTLS